VRVSSCSSSSAFTGFVFVFEPECSVFPSV
jgi:hypothetical protein